LPVLGTVLDCHCIDAEEVLVEAILWCIMAVKMEVLIHSALQERVMELLNTDLVSSQGGRAKLASRDHVLAEQGKWLLKKVGAGD
jgi:hypothetical protein